MPPSQPMAPVSPALISEQLEVADQLLAGRETMLEPQDLPGRYGRVVAAVDHVLAAIGCDAVVGGGWAVWRHGFVGRVTQDLDIVLPANRVEEFLRAASVSGFQVIPLTPSRWPKLLHKETDTRVDILPEGERPGMPSRLAPTRIPHPGRLGAQGTRLAYMHLPGLIELKIAAGRARDTADIIELIRVNASQVDGVRAHLEAVHPGYATTFDQLTEQAREQTDQ